ncbi:MAG: hypothetical protein EXX96DRAFT_552549 [Benjaminiella poitrasii]|nr:MAG: hypothetical protein EXX96DRAFT_552549 [Benjaminiella poitrasii]
MKSEKSPSRSPFHPYTNRRSILSPTFQSPSSEASSTSVSPSLVQTDFRTAEADNTDFTTSPSSKRKYSSLILDYPPSRTSDSFLRSNTFTSDVNDDNGTRWTKEHWKKLEQYYIRKNYDYERAAIAFYYVESLVTVSSASNDDPDNTELTLKELWPKEHIIWRCKCLDTSTRFYGGVLPSERSKKRKVETTVSSPPRDVVNSGSQTIAESEYPSQSTLFSSSP